MTKDYILIDKDFLLNVFFFVFICLSSSSQPHETMGRRCQEGSQIVHKLVPTHTRTEYHWLRPQICDPVDRTCTTLWTSNVITPSPFQKSTCIVLCKLTFITRVYLKARPRAALFCLLFSTNNTDYSNHKNYFI